MKKLYKYPRTFHLPWSEGITSDDKVLKDLSHFIGKEVVVTEKLDGENCLDGDTIIYTEDGNKTIKEICENGYKGKVLTKNLENDINEWKEILNTFINCDDKEWFEIELENNSTIKITGEHLVWLPKLNCYKKVKQLRGDEEIEFLNYNYT